MPPIAGTIQYGHNVAVGYYDQTLGDLDPKGKVIDEVWNLDHAQTELQVRSYLAKMHVPLFVWSLLTLPFAIFGLVRTIAGPRRWFLSLPFFVILAFTLGAIVFWGALRMRVPIEPLVVLYAAAGFEEARRRFLTRRRGLRVIAGTR